MRIWHVCRVGGSTGVATSMCAVGDGALRQEVLGHMPQQDAVRSGDPQRLRVLNIPLIARNVQKVPAPELARDTLLQPLVRRHGSARRRELHHV